MYNTHWDVVGVGVCITLTLGCSRCGCMYKHSHWDVVGVGVCINTHTGM